MDKNLTWKKKEGLKNLKEREELLFKDFNGSRKESRAYKIKGLNDALNLIIKFKNKKIRAVGDYDVDGMTSVASLVLLARKLELKDFNWTVPNRFTEGYGLSTAIIERFLPKLEPNEEGLLITIDNGIAAIDAMSYAKELGWSILIIDHHLPYINEKGVKILPVADVVIDPHALPGTANFDDYCGAGLIYKLAQLAILDDDDPTMMKITSLACFGTICDSVDFIREIGGSFAYDNYLLVKRGLFTLGQNAGKTTGLHCLLRANGHEYKITTGNIGFMEGPQLNSVSRLNDAGAIESIKLLILDNNDFNTGDVLAQQIIECNNLRKKMCEEIMPVLEKRIEDEHMENDYPLVICGKPGEIHLGIIGIIAGHLEEKYKTAVIVCTPIEGEEHLLKGSARAPKGCNIKLILDGASKELIGYGGHEAAAGLSLNKENFVEFKRITQAIAGIKPEDFSCLYYDYDIKTEDIPETFTLLKEHEPYGKGHEAPVFRIADFSCEKKFGEYYSILGKDAKTLKLNNKSGNAINFSGKEVEKYKELGFPNHVKIYGTITANEWNGKITPQIQFSDIENID